MDKETLEGLWNEATGLDDAKHSPLAIAIIAEALSEEGLCSPREAARRVLQIASDCEDFAVAIRPRQG